MASKKVNEDFSEPNSIAISGEDKNIFKVSKDSETLFEFELRPRTPKIDVQRPILVSKGTQTDPNDAAEVEITRNVQSYTNKTIGLESWTSLVETIKVRKSNVFQEQTSSKVRYDKKDGDTGETISITVTGERDETQPSEKLPPPPSIASEAKSESDATLKDFEEEIDEQKSEASHESPTKTCHEKLLQSAQSLPNRKTQVSREAIDVELIEILAIETPNEA